MTEKVEDMGSPDKAIKKTGSASEVERAAIRELVVAARARGEDLTGPDGLLKVLTKTVLETALEEEISEHLGYDKHAVEGRNGANSRNGRRTKTVTTDAVGPVEIEVPRDRDGTFSPVIVAKRQRRLADVDTVVLSLYAKGLTTGEISAHFAEVYGASVSKDTVSRITDAVLEDMQAWSARPLLPIYAAVFIDAIRSSATSRSGTGLIRQVGNRPFYAAIGVDLQGRRDVLGLWAGNGAGESVKFWLSVLTDLKNQMINGRAGRVLPGLRRAQGLAGLRERGVPAGHRADLRDPPDPRDVPVRVQAVLGGPGQGSAPDLHRPDRGGGLGGVRDVRGDLGHPLPGDRQAVAKQLGGVHPVPGLRRR